MLYYELIASVKKIFLKASSFKEKLKEIYLNLSLCEEQLNTVKCYLENIQWIKYDVSTFNFTSTVAIEKENDFEKNNCLHNF